MINGGGGCEVCRRMGAGLGASVGWRSLEGLSVGVGVIKDEAHPEVRSTSKVVARARCAVVTNSILS
jgi:hypothetical protein